MLVCSFSRFCMPFSVLDGFFSLVLWFLMHPKAPPPPPPPFSCNAGPFIHDCVGAVVFAVLETRNRKTNTVWGKRGEVLKTHTHTYQLVIGTP